MSREQPQRPQHEPIKYGDVFNIKGDLAGQPVLPREAAMMQTAENAMLGQTQKGGAASVMQSAAMRNERAGLVDNNGANIVAGDQGVSITETDLRGKRIIIEAVGSHVVAQYSQKAPSDSSTLTPSAAIQQSAGGKQGRITIGDALEATALTAGKKPIEFSDAAAIQAAEVRATGRTTIVPGGIAASAQSAATLNARTAKDEEKTKLGDILTNARTKLPSDRPATRRDAEGVSGAEMRNDPNLTTHPTGVSASVAAAARLNQIDKGLEFLEGDVWIRHDQC